MPPTRRTERPAPHQSSAKGRKGKEKAEEKAEEAPHSASPSQPTAKSGRSTRWTVDDEDYLLEYATANKPAMSNDHSFKPQFWSDLAGTFPAPVHGKPKTAESCREKWKRMKHVFEIVDRLANTPGLVYSLAGGVDVKPGHQHVWDELVKTTKGVSMFEHKGWAHYEKMQLLLGSKDRGHHDTASLQAAVSSSHANTSSTSLTSLPSIPPVFPACQPLQAPASCSIPTLPDLPATSDNLLLSPAFLPPSVPSSYVGSPASSVKPSSSVSVRAERANRHKADDGAAPVVSASAPSMSMIGGVTSTSASSREWRAAQDAQLQKVLIAFRGLCEANVQFMESAMQVITSRQGVPQAAPSNAVPRPEAGAAGKRRNAWKVLMERDQDFLTVDELVTMVDAFGSDNDLADAYLLLAMSPDGRFDEARRCWLKRRIAVANATHPRV